MGILVCGLVAVAIAICGPATLSSDWAVAGDGADDGDGTDDAADGTDGAANDTDSSPDDTGDSLEPSPPEE